MNSMPFDPQAFLDLPVEVAFERRKLIPVQDYVATIQDLVPRQWQSKTKVDESGALKSGLAFDVKLVIDLPADVQEACNLKSPTLTLEDGVIVDLLPGGTGFDFTPGRNGRLRLYREATDMNKSGEMFRPRLLIGKVLKVRVNHVPIERDGQQTGDFREALGALSRA